MSAGFDGASGAPNADNAKRSSPGASAELSADTNPSQDRRDNAHDAPSLDHQVAIVNDALARVSNHAARRATLENWRKCLIGDAHDESYFVRGILKKTSSHVFERIMDEFGDVLLDNASDEFLDRAVELRLQTVGAKTVVPMLREDLLDSAMEYRLTTVTTGSLFAMLAQARRLGYDVQDVVSDDGNVPAASDEKIHSREAGEMSHPSPAVVQAVQNHAQHPQMQPRPPAPAIQPRPTAPAPAPAPAPHPPSHPSSGLSSHVESDTRTRDDSPSNPKKRFLHDACGKYFTQKAGLMYHMSNNVCRTSTEPNAPIIHRCPHAKEVCKTAPRIAQAPAPVPFHHGQPAFGPSAQPVPPATPAAPAAPAFIPRQYYPSDDIKHSTPTTNGTPVSHEQNGRPLTPSSRPDFRVQPQSQIPPGQDVSQRHHSLPRHLQTQHDAPLQPTAVSQNQVATPTQVLTQSPSSSRAHTPIDTRQLIEPSSLDPATRLLYEGEMADELASHEHRMAEIPQSDPEHADKITRLKQIHATKKTTIRKKFGLRARIRRSSKMPQASNSPESANGRMAQYRAPTSSTNFSAYSPAPVLSGAPDAKRRRINYLPPGGPEDSDRSTSFQPRTKLPPINADQRAHPPAGPTRRQSSSFLSLDVDPEVAARAQEIRVRNSARDPTELTRSVKRVPIPAGLQASWESLQPRGPRSEDYATPTTMTKPFTPINHSGSASALGVEAGKPVVRPPASAPSTKLAEMAKGLAPGRPIDGSSAEDHHGKSSNDDDDDDDDEDIPAKRRIGSVKDSHQGLSASPVTKRTVSVPVPTAKWHGVGGGI
ncbi:MAG: hypothetical protein M1818_005503 [Claussenomyces sp. TS43310]|nr:MAG: hypothetical protein M1818_005503 [Claussenomyces sp. TS43310]